MTWHTLLVILFTVLDIACIVAVIFVERKNPSSTIAWTLVLLFLPFVGFAAYLLFGSGFHVNKRKRYGLKQVSDNLYKKLLGGHVHSHTVCAEDGMACSRLVAYLARAAGHPFTGDNTADIFTEGNSLFDSMKADLRGAKKHIHMLYYIFRNDELGNEIVAILTERARNGVEVRVIYDSLGSIFSVGAMFRELIEAGGQVEAFSPLFMKLSSHLRLNYRNHRKITVVDGLVGYVGGMNIGTEYCGRHKRLRPWRDTQLRLTGSSVLLLQERFLMDWISVREDLVTSAQLERFFPRPLQGGSLDVQIASSGPDTAVMSIKNGLLEMLYTARRNIYIQTPYFTPDDSFIEALQSAAMAGIDVRLMVPGVGDNLLATLATYGYASHLLEAGVRVFRYQGFLHAKTMVIDSVAASIGTANIGNRSFAVNFEINAFVYDYEFAAACERIFLDDQSCCLELDAAWFAERSPLTHMGYRLTRLFAPLM